ncbi:MAG: hypothetical protein V3U72_03855 [Candidatus Aenigmarchaeota archaeon]
MGREIAFVLQAEKDGKALFSGEKAGKLYISKMEIINVRILNGLEKGFKATLGKAAQSPIHLGMN